MKKKLLVISGSSGVGKGTVLKEVLKTRNDIKYSISCTTRNPREGEVHGQHYFFLSKDDFMNDVKKGNFLEWAEFSGNFYGTNRELVQKMLNDGFNVSLEIETDGAMQVKKKVPDCTMIFIAPPSIEELERRLRGRNTETEEAIQKRLKMVKIELERSKNYDYIVINDEVSKAAAKILEIIDA
ncbi:guanylate kinase [bacterium]|nr:guanylate kinase [bacterium]